MTRYLTTHPPMLTHALLGLIAAGNAVVHEQDRTAWRTTERDLPAWKTTVHMADLRTSLADWRGLVAIRVAEAEANL